VNNHDIFLTAASDLIGLLGWLLIGYVAVWLIYQIWLVRNHRALTRKHYQRHQKRERRDYHITPVDPERRTNGRDI
jgi:ABC-type nickel/cobalt efflux system permease component RcnA